ncbi:MAG: hypothetical protein LBM19_00515, partial [Holosporales bacterium]|nr:hypothetical protein [Holosporales bacterium]
SFSRCRGNGASLVRESLFPKDLPPSLEDYLLSFDPSALDFIPDNYKNLQLNNFYFNIRKRSQYIE